MSTGRPRVFLGSTSCKRLPIWIRRLKMPIQFRRKPEDYQEPAREEPTYVTDEDLRPANQRPKWTVPTGLAVEILAAVGRKYYLSREERTAVLDVVKGSLSLESGIIAAFPREWLLHCM